MFDGLYGDQSPLPGLMRGVFAIEVCHDSFGEQRHNASGPQFGRLLDYRVHYLSLGNGLQQRDLPGEGWLVALFDDRQLDLVASAFLHFAQKLMARAIQYRNAFSRAAAYDMQGMVSLAPSQQQACLLALVRRQIKAMHESWSYRVTEFWSRRAGFLSSGSLTTVQHSHAPVLHHPLSSMEQFLCLLEEALTQRAFLPVAEVGEFLKLGLLVRRQ